MNCRVEKQPQPRWFYFLVYLTALAAAAALFGVASLRAKAQPPAYTSNAVFPVLDYAVPHYPNRPIRNTVRHWCGLPPLQYSLPPSYPRNSPLAKSIGGP